MTTQEIRTNHQKGVSAIYSMILWFSSKSTNFKGLCGTRHIYCQLMALKEGNRFDQHQTIRNDFILAWQGKTGQVEILTASKQFPAVKELQMFWRMSILVLSEDYCSKTLFEWHIAKMICDHCLHWFKQPDLSQNAYYLCPTEKNNISVGQSLGNPAITKLLP